MKTAILILLICVSSVFGQTVVNDGDKQESKATLFDEFGEISQKEIKSRTLKLREKLQEPSSRKTQLGAYIVLYAKTKKGKNIEIVRNLIVKGLSDNCRDCYGYGGRLIVFVNGGEVEKQKVQFWLLPLGAEPPTP